jgi:hypothetical protein
VFAVYQPHQSEEKISCLITGSRSAVLFDTGMGIADMGKVISELSKVLITGAIQSTPPSAEVRRLAVAHAFPAPQCSTAMRRRNQHSSQPYRDKSQSGGSRAEFHSREC